MLNKKISLYKWQFNIIVILVFSVGLVSGIYTMLYEIIPNVHAATSPWTQTDWSGGSGSSTSNQYSSISNIVDGTAGQIILDDRSDWYNSSWQYRKKITFDNTTSTLGTTAEALTDFPVLIKLDSGSDIDYSKTMDNGEDLRFTDSDGSTPLTYEIEKWDESGSSYAWVKVPQIDQDSSTDYVYMYYGNSGASDGQSASSVWSDNFALVYHFNEASGTSGASSVNDSTGNTSGTPSAGISFDQSGQISTTADFSSGTGISLGTIGSSLLTDSATVEFWINTSNYASPSRQNPFEQAYGGWGTMTVETGGQISWFFGSSGVNGSPYGSHQSSSLISNSSWIKVTGVRNPSGYTYSWYKNGVYLNGSTYDSSYPVISDKTFTIGDGYVNPINGKIDEFRVSNTARSTAWVAATYYSETDSFNTFGSIEGKYASSGTLTSNIFDAGFEADWGTLSFDSTGSGTVTVKVRTDGSSDMSDATAWGSCSGVSSGTDLSGTGCVSDNDQYVQYQIALAPSGVNSPTFNDITIAFTASDIIVPPTNATSIDITSVNEGAWTKTEPTFTWTAGADNSGGSGLLGYCVSLDEATPGSSSSLDPTTGAGVLAGLDDGVSQAYCPFIATGTSLDLSAISGLTLTSGNQYYFSIKAVDIAGNIWTGSSGNYQDLASFKYDDTSPTNPSGLSAPQTYQSSVSGITIYWATSGSTAASDSDSGLQGYQYRIGSSGTWYGDSHTGGSDCSDLITGNSYALDGSIDTLSTGNNTYYMRTFDNVCNMSSDTVTAILKFSGDSPNEPQSLAVTPSTNTANSFAFSWSSPTTYSGLESGLTYCYTINTVPSSANCTWTSSTSLSADAYATQPSTNTFYVIAKDEAGNVNYDAYSSVQFTANTSAPGMPQNIDVADVSVKASSSWKLTLSWEAPASIGAGVENYKVYHSTDGSTYSLESTVTGISYVDTGLTQVTHYYKVKACDSANNCGAFTSAVSLYPDGKYTSSASLTSGPSSSSITTKKATITWSTDRASDSKIQYGTSTNSYYTEEPSNSSQVTDHTINLTSLSAGTTYYFKAKWTDEDGNTGTSDEKSFTTDSAPTVIDPQAKNVGVTSGIIKYTVVGATKVKIYYGETTSFGGLKEISTSTSETTYTTELSGLADGIKYYYKINTFDSEDEEYEGNILTFTTLPRPRISKVRIQQVKGTAQPTVLVSWTTNTDVSSIITYYPTNNPPAARDEVNVTLQKGVHKMIIRSLSPNTPYTLLVKGRDKLGNEAVSDPNTFTTATDTRPPQITNLKVEGTIIPTVSTSGQEQLAQLVVSWITDEASTSQVEFGEGTGTTYSQKTQMDNNMTFNHLVVISNLTPSKVYHLRAISLDEVGNKTNSIDTVTITPKAMDNALDLVISNLQQAFGFLGRI